MSLPPQIDLTQASVTPLDLTQKRVFVAGHTGMAGSAIGAVSNESLARCSRRRPETNSTLPGKIRRGGHIRAAIRA